MSSCLNYLVLIDYNRLVLAALLMNRCLYTCWYGLAMQSKNTEDESLVNSMWSKVYVTVGCPSVCLSHRSTAAMAAGRFAAECPAGRRYKSIAAGVVLQAPVLSSRCG